MTPARGEVWHFDLAMAEKVRPALVVSTPYQDSDRALLTVIPHTTRLRGSSHEIVARVPFLRPGAFLVQAVATYPNVRAMRKLGTLRPTSNSYSPVFSGGLDTSLRKTFRGPRSTESCQLDFAIQ